MSKLKKLFLLLAGLLLGASLSFVLAWSDPASNPPLGGGNLQTDGSGNLVISSGDLRLSTTTTDLFVEAGTASFGTTASPAANQKVLILGNLQMGNSTNQKGVTFYDTSGGAAYCLRVTSGALSLTSGSCP